MTDKTQAIVEQALKLSPTERADVAEQLLASLDEALDSDVEKAWQEEIQRRRQQVERGEVELIDSDTVMAELRKKHA
ncbi:MAG: addiction module protein [Nitrospirota bacterium]|nr:addiction module protein [Nitrospirota bacterium]